MIRTAVILSAALSFAAPAAKAVVVMLDPAFVSCTAALLNQTTSYQNVVNQSGLSTTYINQVTPFTTFVAANPTSNIPPGNFTLTSGSTASYVFDLGTRADLASVIVWNSISGATNRVANFTVRVSDNVNFTNPTTLGTFSTNTSNPSYPVAGEVFTLTPATGRYVQVDFTNAGGGATTFGEIAFAGTVVPETSSALLAGAGLLGLMVRRRRC